MRDITPVQRHVIGVILAAALIGNAAAQEDKPPAPSEPIALIKIQHPSTIRMENDPHLLVAGLAMLGISKIRNASMSERLTSELYRLNANYGGLLSDELKKHLMAANIAVTDAPPIAVNPEKPWNYKFPQLTASGPHSLYVYFEKIGIRSHHQTSYYQPQAYIVFCGMTFADKKDCTYGGSIAFGDNHEHEDENTILATPAERWFDDQSAYLRASEIDQALRRGIMLAAERIARQIVKANETQK